MGASEAGAICVQTVLEPEWDGCAHTLLCRIIIIMAVVRARWVECSLTSTFLLWRARPACLGSNGAIYICGVRWGVLSDDDYGDCSESHSRVKQYCNRAMMQGCALLE